MYSEVYNFFCTPVRQPHYSVPSYCIIPQNIYIRRRIYYLETSHAEQHPTQNNVSLGKFPFFPPLPLQLIGGQSTLCPIVLSVSNYFSLEYQISQEFIASCLWDTSNNKKIIDIDKADLDQSMYQTRIHSLLKKQQMILEPRMLIVIDNLNFQFIVKNLPIQKIVSKI